MCTVYMDHSNFSLFSSSAITIGFTMGSYNVSEGYNVTVCVQILNGCLDRAADVTVNADFDTLSEVMG